MATRLGWPGCPLSRQPRAVDVSPLMPAHCGTVPEGQVPPATACMVGCKSVLPDRDGEGQAGLKIGSVLLEHLTSLFWKATVLPPPAPHQLMAAFALTWAALIALISTSSKFIDFLCASNSCIFIDPQQYLRIPTPGNVQGQFGWGLE